MVDQKLRYVLLQNAFELRTVKPFDKLSLFADILDDTRQGAEKFVAFFGEFCSEDHKNQRKRFLELISRTDKMKDWAGFLEHENSKKEGPWKGRSFGGDNGVLKFAIGLRAWCEKSETKTDKHLNSILRGFADVSSLGLTSEDYYRWRCLLLRDAFEEIMEG